jgi:hypothetical protein
MENKQTAMQQLMDWMNKESEVIPVWIGDVYDKAEELLQLEKEQIKDAFLLSDTANGSNEDAEQYYNETYNINK